MNLKVKYLGLELDNPIVVASSPFTMAVDRIERLQHAGAGAVVLKSVFEEQIMGEADYLARYNDHSIAADYLNNYLAQGYIDGHLKLISESKKKVDMPVIASINCRTSDKWIDYASSIEQAGADALELNIFLLPTSATDKAEDIEKHYLEIVEKVTEKINIPVSVKLGMRFTNVLDVCRELYYRNCKGVVMFNRFWEPDIDIEKMEMVAADSLSEHSELRNSLRSIGLCHPQLKELDIAVSSGVHTGEDVIKSILVGAKVTQVCTALYLSGVEVIGEMKKEVSAWMERRGIASVDEFRGLMSHKDYKDAELYERVQYMKFMPKE